MPARISHMFVMLIMMAASAAFAATVTINQEVKFQTIEGWGASSNFFENQVARLDEETRELAFDYVYRDLGANILCIRLYADFQTEEGGAFNWNVMANQRMIVTEALRRGSINKIWCKISSPPGWMKDNNDNAHAGHLLEEHYQDYADYLSTYVRGMRDNYRITIDAVSIFNEPGWEHNNVDYESTSTTPEEYRDVLKVVGATFERDGISHVQLMGPESGHLTGNRGSLTAYLPVILADSVAAGYLDLISSHQYGDQLVVYGNGDPDDWEGLSELASEHDLPIWETEMFIGGPEMASEDIHEGLRVAMLIWTAQTLGHVNAWHYWQYLHPDESEANKSPGVVSLPPRGGELGVFPRYYVMKHWMSNVPEGSVRIQAESDDENLRVTAYENEETVVIVAFNKTEHEIEAEFNLTGIIDDVEQIRTDENENYVQLEAIEPTESGFQVTIPQFSVQTLIVPVVAQNISEDCAIVPQFMILDCYPNPFNSMLRVNFSLERQGGVNLSIINTAGGLISTLALGSLSPGPHTVLWDGADLPTGLYFIRMQEGTTLTVKPILLLR